MENASLFERLNSWIRNSVTIKLLSMGLLILLLLIPAFMIQSLIREREYRQQEAIREVSGTWSLAQTLAGPMLVIPYKVYRTTDNDQVIETTQHAYFLPDRLVVEGEVLPETRYRGIYEVVVYTSQFGVTGHFPTPDFSEWSIRPEDILWNEATVIVGLSDLRGINETVQLHWNADTLAFNPGIETQPTRESTSPRAYDPMMDISSGDVLASGISTRVPVTAQAPASGTYTFAFDLDLNGSQALRFIPLGRETDVHLASTWASPSFDGAFLPDERTVTGDGFQSDWRVLHLNRNYPQQWRGASVSLNESAFGVTLLVPVDQYQKSMRAAKYAILVIALTFLVFFFAEIRNRERVHPFQYILVGLALCLFYTLLLAASEQVPFNMAYVLAGLATIGLVTAYTRSIFASRTLSLLAGGVLLVLYGFVFVILQLQDYALLVGSIGLFIALALTMYLSRNIDWYTFKQAA